MTRSIYRAPSCGHSACSQHWIDTGLGVCVARVDAVASLIRAAVVVVWALAIGALLCVEVFRPEWIMRLGGYLHG